tara:strand:- start:2132 stop:2332 length:201 start_codon:yes stop_codon:yes gene_type:complete
MIILGVSFSLHVPILNSPNNMPLIARSKLKLDLIPTFSIRILKQKIETSSARMNALLITEHQIAQA